MLGLGIKSKIFGLGFGLEAHGVGVGLATLSLGVAPCGFVNVTDVNVSNSECNVKFFNFTVYDFAAGS